MKLHVPPGMEDLDTFGCGALHVDGDGQVIHANEFLVSWLKTEPKDLRAVLSPGSAAYWELAVEPQLAHGGKVTDVALSLRGGDRGVLAFAYRAHGVTHILFVPVAERHRYQHALAAAERRAAEDQAELRRLRDMDRMHRNFINAIAHEIATPMTPIRLQLAVLERWTKMQDDGPRKALQSILRNLDKLERFHTGLMEAADLQAQPSHGTAMVSLDGLASETVRSWQESTQRKVDLDLEAAQVEADPESLRRCIVHLLDNAARFSPMDAPIHVSCRGDRLTIRDHGRGMDPTRIARLGRPFAKAHDDAEFTGLGAGLGLYVVKELMTAMGGTLELDSPGRGQGTSATLRLSTQAVRDRRPKRP